MIQNASMIQIHISIRHLLSIGLMAFPAYGQGPVNPKLLKTTNRFHQYIQNHPQEKVYLHLDKTQTALGETIWFKAYLMDAATHTETTASSLVYVDLIDPHPASWKRGISMPARKIGAGDFFIPPGSLPGNYTIRAYTQYMRNFDEAFFYHQVIRVLNPYDRYLMSSGVGYPESPGVWIRFFPICHDPWAKLYDGFKLCPNFP